MTSSRFPAKLVEANCKPEKHEHQAKSQQWGLATVRILPREQWSSDSGLCFLCGRGRGWVCAYVHVEAGADAAGLPPSRFTFVFETGPLTEAEAHWLGKSGWQVCGDLSVPTSPVLWLHVYATAWLFFFFNVGACVWTWHLMPAWQALYWLSHLPNAPQFMFFNVLSLDHPQ